MGTSKGATPCTNTNQAGESPKGGVAKSQVPMIETAQKMVDTLSQKAPTRSSWSIYIGLQNDQAVAKAVNGIDLIVGGHSQTFLGDINEINSVG